MKRELIELLRSDMTAFAKKCFAELNGGELPDNAPYFKLLVAFAEDVASGKIRRGIVNMPPRHLKTQMLSVTLVARMLGQNPNLKVMVVTHGDELSRDIAYDTRKILRCAWYQEAFGTRLSESRYVVTDFATEQGGGVFATSVRGAITGRGADLVIVDDPVKIVDATNINVHERIAGLFATEILRRLNRANTGQILIVGHRLHPQDLTGHYEGRPGWQQLVLPFIASEASTMSVGRASWHRKAGELLRPDAFSKAEVNEIQALVGPPDFETLFQQNARGVPWEPLADDSFPRFPGPVPNDAPLVVSVDPAQAANARASFWVAQAWAVMDGAFVLVDQRREQTGYDGMVAAMPRFLKRHLPSIVLVEETSTGIALVEKLKRNRNSDVISIPTPTASKTERLKSCIAVIRSRRVMIAHGAPFREEFVEELTGFPHAPSDDQVDAMTQFLNFLATSPDIRPRPQRAISDHRTIKGIAASPTNIEVYAPGGRAISAVGKQRRF
jgi:predicted phage terminase large subunit-like protein